MSTVFRLAEQLPGSQGVIEVISVLFWPKSILVVTLLCYQNDMCKSTINEYRWASGLGPV